MKNTSLKVTNILIDLSFGIGMLSSYLANEPIVTMFLLIGFCGYNFLQQYRTKKLFSVDPGLLFTVAAFIMAISNLLALLAANSAQKELYFIYAREEHSNTAMLIAGLGSLCLILGYNWYNQFKKPFIKLLKFRDIQANYTSVYTLVLFSVAVIMIRNTFGIPGFLGAIEGFIILLPTATIFFLSRLSSLYNKKEFSQFALLVLILETGRAIMFDFLRLHYILPSVAYLLGYIVGSQNSRSVFKVRLLPAYIILGAFIYYFSFLGEARSKVGVGSSRITELQELATDEYEGDNTLFMRFSNINQLTNVVQIVKEDGFYNGTTLEYLGFAFIPRILWPDKPLIQLGAWFAQRIGRGYVDEDGRAHNAINMTASGELYMNFGWMGVIAGSFIFGVIIAVFWKTISFWGIRNVFSNLFGFYLLFLALFSFGANLSILVTLLAMYLIMYFVSYSLKLLTK